MAYEVLVDQDRQTVVVKHRGLCTRTSYADSQCKAATLMREAGFERILADYREASPNVAWLELLFVTRELRPLFPTEVSVASVYGPKRLDDRDARLLAEHGLRHGINLRAFESIEEANDWLGRCSEEPSITTL